MIKPISLAILVYDYAITFPSEVQLFWGRKPTGATLLFFTNRYLVLSFWIIDTATVGPVSDAVSSCAPSNHADDTDAMHLTDVRTPYSFLKTEKTEPISCHSCEFVTKFGAAFEYMQYLPWACEWYSWL